MDFGLFFKDIIFAVVREVGVMSFTQTKSWFPRWNPEKRARGESMLRVLLVLMMFNSPVRGAENKRKSPLVKAPDFRITAELFDAKKPSEKIFDFEKIMNKVLADPVDITCKVLL